MTAAPAEKTRSHQSCGEGTGWLLQAGGSPRCENISCEKSEPNRGSTLSSSLSAGAIYNLSSDFKSSSENKKKVEVIDLTLDSSSDEDEPPAKRTCPVTSTIMPSMGSKGVISIDHQSSVLRSPPMATISSDYLSSIPLPDYHRTFPVPTDLQGLDLFSFLQTTDNSQHYSPSVITSLDEQDALGHYFQYRPTHYMSTLTQAITGSHTTTSSTSRISSIVSTSTLQESHAHSTTQSSSSTLQGCRPDIISLD
ncbi:E3 SUMO-protein ligase PIAS3 [Hyperolius riggenbachi]|uniref:E3 SUMO-protein ligase PIAS3 n=1 Tax=Hyperolius riggenbachi TaxID=752182 RepID=UPI0035A381E4